jgi:D-xylulose reductase
MRALVLEKKLKLKLRDIDLNTSISADDVKIKMHTVGICGSDIHYYEHGKIGQWHVNTPMVLGHEGSGIVIEVGENEKKLKVGDRVCIEPQVVDKKSKEYKLGIYNYDQKVKFWATPPIHGCLTPEVVFPGDMVFKIPDHMSFSEGAMVEPLAVGMQGVTKAKIKPGQTALVMGCGPIGLVTALAALAGGCSKVYIADILTAKLKVCENYQDIIPVDLNKEDLAKKIMSETNGWGVDRFFECSGAVKAYDAIFSCCSPGAHVVLIGNNAEPVPMNWAILFAKGLEFQTVHRYSHQYENSIRLLSSGKINVKPLITEIFSFDQSIKAFERAAEHRPTDVKLQITFND